MDGRQVSVQRLDRYPFRDWTRQQLEKPFGVQSSNNFLKQLMNLTQTGSVLDYHAEFERLSAYFPEIASEVLETAYIRGLRHDIQQVLEMHSPIGLRQTMDISVQTEKYLFSIYESSKGNLTSRGTPIPQMADTGRDRNYQTNSGELFGYTEERRLILPNGNKPNAQMDLGALSKPEAPRLKAPPRRLIKLTEQEMQERRKKGLCFYCNDKFGPGHRL